MQNLAWTDFAIIMAGFAVFVFIVWLVQVIEEKLKKPCDDCGTYISKKHSIFLTERKEKEDANIDGWKATSIVISEQKRVCRGCFVKRFKDVN